MNTVNYNLDELLGKLDRLVNIKHYRESEELQARTTHYKPVRRLPCIIRWPAGRMKDEWPVFSKYEQCNSKEALLLSQLGNIYEGVLIGDDSMFSIRAEYGVAVIPSIFGCKTISVKDTNTASWADPIGKDGVIKAVSKGRPTLRTGLSGKAFEFYEWARRKIDQFPNLKKTVQFIAPDLQGPFGLAELIFGHEIFLALYDEAKLIHEFLTLLTETIIFYEKEVRRIARVPEGVMYSGLNNLCGGVRIVQDTEQNIAAEMYNEFSRPYCERIFNEFGLEGSVHYCGRHKQFFPSLIDSKGMRGLNMIYLSYIIAVLISRKPVVAEHSAVSLLFHEMGH